MDSISDEAPESIVDDPIDERLRQGLEALLPAPEITHEEAAELAGKIVQKAIQSQA
jgi:hypothetical protein